MIAASCPGKAEAAIKNVNETMAISHSPPDSASPHRVVRAEAFRLAKSRAPVADVTLDVAGLRVRCLVRHTPHGLRFAWPSLRGAPAVLDTAERAHLQDLAAEAAQQVIGRRPLERAA